MIVFPCVLSAEHTSVVSLLADGLVPMFVFSQVSNFFLFYFTLKTGSKTGRGFGEVSIENPSLFIHSLPLESEDDTLFFQLRMRGF